VHDVSASKGTSLLHWRMVLFGFGLTRWDGYLHDLAAQLNISSVASSIVVRAIRNGVFNM
jgi:hypothetical protein